VIKCLLSVYLCVTLRHSLEYFISSDVICMGFICIMVFTPFSDITTSTVTTEYAKKPEIVIILQRTEAAKEPVPAETKEKE